jgi:hypothetical protein
MKSQLICIAALLALSACRREAPPVADAQKPDTIRNIVDSIFPVEEEIRRFKAARNGVAAAELEHASTSRDALVQRYLTAVQKRDSADLRAMTLNAAEFIDLYYPTSMYSHPPYKQSPEIVWLMMQQNSDGGLRRVLDRFGGQTTHLQSYSCKPELRTEGQNKFWDECTLHFTAESNVPQSAVLFGPVLERGGKFKILSFSNSL